MAIELNKNFDLAYCGRGDVYGLLKLYDLAIKEFTDALAINSNKSGKQSIKSTSTKSCV